MGTGESGHHDHHGHHGNPSRVVGVYMMEAGIVFHRQALLTRHCISTASAAAAAVAALWSSSH